LEIPPSKPLSWNLVRTDSPDEKQQERWRSWLGQGSSGPEEKIEKGE
jgi:hypothetical protein